MFLQMQPLRFLENTGINVKCYKEETFAFGFQEDREKTQKVRKIHFGGFELTFRLGG